jgi:hypothetical protein
MKATGDVLANNIQTKNTLDQNYIKSQPYVIY